MYWAQNISPKIQRSKNSRVACSHGRVITLSRLNKATKKSISRRFAEQLLTPSSQLQTMLSYWEIFNYLISRIPIRFDCLAETLLQGNWMVMKSVFNQMHEYRAFTQYLLLLTTYYH